MAYKNSYVGHADDEIDFDMIFGRVDQKEMQQRKQKLLNRDNDDVLQSQVNMAEQKQKSSHSLNDLVSHVPFMIYKVADPNMRSISDDYLKVMPYNDWTETKFFKPEQIQEVICTEYPDKAWTIDRYNKEFLMEDINSTFQKQMSGKSGFDLSLLIETKFERDHPSDKKTASGKQVRKLDITEKMIVKPWSN